MVLLALRKIPTANPRRRDAAFQRGLNWMLTFQCKDGGWASFDKDCTKSILEKVPFADHNAMLDPECADITARILELLGYENFSLEHPQVRKALEFIREHQEEDGSWYGRWGVNYIYGTWQVLRGLRALGLDMRQPWILKARDWLESVQHEDGGWGERCDTYDDPVFKGQGPSTASQTAWAVMGLCAFDDPHRPSIQNGIEYLDPHPEPRRHLDRIGSHRHRFPARVLFEVRHVSEQLAAAGPGHLSQPFQQVRSQTRPQTVAVPAHCPRQPRAGPAIPAVSWFYRSLLRPVLFAQDAEKIHDRTLRALCLRRPPTASHRPDRRPLCRAGISRGTLRPPLSQSRRPGGGHGQTGRRPCPPGRRSVLVSANWAPSPGILSRAIRPRACSAPSRTRRLSIAWASTTPAPRPSPPALARWRQSGLWPAHPVGINLGKSKITPLANAAQDYADTFRLLRPLADFFVVNVSSPNTPDLRQLQDKSALDEILAALQQNNPGPARRSRPGQSRPRSLLHGAG